MTADQRITAAREFLQHARKMRRTWAAESPAVLARECAELRKHLGQVLDVIGQSRVVLGQALGDAIAHREPGGFCIDCDAYPSGLCCDHAEDLDRCDAYGELARTLGVEL